MRTTAAYYEARETFRDATATYCYWPEDAPTEAVETGANYVFLVGDQAVLKTPMVPPIPDPVSLEGMRERRRLHNRAKSLLRQEGQVLTYLDYEGAFDNAPVAAPRILAENFEPLSYNITSFIPGAVLAEEEIVERFTVAEKEGLGSKVAEFIVWLSAAMPLEESERMSTNRPLYNREQGFLESAQNSDRIRAAGYAALADTLEEVADLHAHYKQRGLLKPTLTGHNDLHEGNLVFDDQHRLRGVIDYGLVQPSTPAREMRHIVDFGEEVVGAAAQRYHELTGEQVPLDLIYFWTLVQNADMSSRRIMTGREPVPRLQEYRDRYAAVRLTA